MKILVGLMYDDISRNKAVEIELDRPLRGPRLLKLLDSKVEEQYHDDCDWINWKFLQMVDDGQEDLPRTEGRRTKGTK